MHHILVEHKLIVLRLWHYFFQIKWVLSKMLTSQTK